MGRLGTSQLGTGQLGEPDTIAAPATSVAVETPAPTVTGAGTATLAAPTTTLVVSTPEPDVRMVLTAPPTTLNVDTPAPTVTGAGTAPLSVPTTTLTLATPTPRVGYGEWVIASNPMGANQSERVTPSTISLTQRVTTATLEESLRPLKSDEGKVNVLAQDSGGFVAVDRANGANTFALIPPITRQPLRESTDVHVRRYEETLISQDVSEWTVELELTRDATREETTSSSELPVNGAVFDFAFPATFGPSEWGLDTRHGGIVTSRVDAEFLGTGEDGVEQFELTTRLTADQAHVFETALNRLGGGRVRSIPDETNVAVDDTTDDAATLTVDAPGGQTVVSDGDYLVRAWESERINEAFQSITLTIAATF